jgi:hypothetical protein
MGAQMPGTGGPGTTPLRLRLWADPSQLAGFDREIVLPNARMHLREQRADVELADIELTSADSIDVVLHAAPTVGLDDLDEIATDLRAFLGIGPGPYAPIRDQPGAFRGIGGQGRTCPDCRASDGSHLLGCPRSGRR